MVDPLKSVRDISRIREKEMRDSNHMRDITHLYPIYRPILQIWMYHHSTANMAYERNRLELYQHFLQLPL